MKKILFSIIAVVVCVAAMGSAFAYFTDVETSEANVLGAGTLDIQIADGNQGYRDTHVSASFNSPTNWAPGQSFEAGPVYLKNVGTISIERIYARFSGLEQNDGVTFDGETPNLNDLASQIVLLSYFESNNGGTSYAEEVFTTSNANAYLAYWNTRGATFVLDGSISLADLVVASSFGSGDHVTALCMFDGGNVVSDPPLVAGATAAFKFKFQLLAATNNSYQGDTASFRVDFIAAQLDTYPDELLFDSITEDLGTPPTLPAIP